MTSSTSSSPAVSRARVADVRNRPRRRREVSAAAARSKGPHRRARGGIGPTLRDDVAVTFIVDRTLLDDDEEGEVGKWESMVNMALDLALGSLITAATRFLAEADELRQGISLLP